MHRFLILLVFSIINFASYGQGVEVSSSLNTSSNILFQGAYGFGVNYQFRPIDSIIQFGVAIHKYYNTTQYEESEIGEMPPFALIGIYYITSKVERTSFRFNVLMVLKDNKYFFWGIGGDISYNILTGKNDVAVYNPNPANILFLPSNQYDLSTVKVFGAAILTKIEIKNIFTPKLSLCFNIRPEFIYGGPKSDMLGGNYYFNATNWPPLGFNRFVEFQLGLKYSFNKKK